MMSLKKNVANLMVECLEKEAVEYVFGIPGEENIKFVRAVTASKNIRFILTRHEQAAAFMADIYGRLTGKAGVCTATLGPGAINLLLGVADAQTDSSPLVAITAQVGINRIYKESHQIVDLVSMFKPVTKWADVVMSKEAVPEMMRKAFALAEEGRPGATYIAIPEDIEALAITAADALQPLNRTTPSLSQPSIEHIEEAVKIIKKAKRPIILAGHGVARSNNSQALVNFAEKTHIPVATTFMGKGVISDKNALALGVVGFMRHDYENFAFDEADLILSIGYELQEFAPSRINPHGDKSIIHIHSFVADTDKNYGVTVNLLGDIGLSLGALSKALGEEKLPHLTNASKIRKLLQDEIAFGAQNKDFPIKPQRLVHDIRQAMGDQDIVLADTGAVKMWMARLYPTYTPLSCLISNGLSTMAWSLPGAMGAALARPQQKVLAVMGDGSFMMNSQEIETAIREKIPLKILIWVDGSYGLIKWKMDIEEGAHDSVDFTNPDFVKYAESFGAKGHLVDSADNLLPTLKKALNEPGVSVIACPVDYSENMKLVHKLGELTISL
jgi:acetolactate synthase-1/2/3 large subunit